MKLLLTCVFVLVVATPSISKSLPNDCTPTLYVATSDGFFSGMVVSTDSGNTWQNRSTPRAYQTMWTIFASSNQLYIGTPGGIEISPDSGLTYAVTGVGNTTAVYTAGMKILAGVNEYSITQVIYMSEDGGKTFPSHISTPGGLSGDTTGVYLIGDRVFITEKGYKGGIAISDDAINWNVFNSKTGLNTSDATSISGEGQNVYVSLGLDGGLIAISEDGGDTFTNMQTTPLGSNGATCVFAAGGQVYVGTNGGGIAMAKSDSVWGSWTVKTAADGLASNKTTAIAAVGDTIIVGTTVGLSVSTDGGQTWVTKTTLDGLQHNRVTAAFANCV